MKDRYSEAFIEALIKKDLDAIRVIPKADLHNHYSLGGNRKYIRDLVGIDIPFLEGVLQSMQDMHDWNTKYIGNKFHNSRMHKFLIDAAFVQAKFDGVRILEIGEDVWGLGEYYNNDIDELIHSFHDSNQRIAPEIEQRLQIGLSRHCSIDYLMNCLKCLMILG